MGKMQNIRFLKQKGDRWLFFLPFFLSLFGLLMIFEASSVAAGHDFGDHFYYLKHQAVSLVLGVGLFLVFARLNYRWLKTLALPGLLVSLVLLVAVLIPGLGRQVYGGRRWLQVNGFGFQPAELTKLSLVVYLATLLEKRKALFPFLLVVGVIFLLLLLEPDLGTALLILAIAFCLYFVAGASWRRLGFLLLGGLVFAPFLIWFSPYRRQRFLTFIDTSFDAQGASYHLRQVLIALGSGGIFGRGLGQSRQKFMFLPEVTTDSIFAVIAEEFGFLGASLLIFAFLFLLYRGLQVAFLAKDSFAQLLVVGMVATIGFQTIINLGAMVALVPLTGVPLPFISYGGSSLLVCLIGMGIVYNISKSLPKTKK